MSEQANALSGRHRNSEELQAALRVINDQLADANDLERPALELVAKKLTDELVEVECELAHNRSSATPCPVENSGSVKLGSLRYEQHLAQQQVPLGTVQHVEPGTTTAAVPQVCAENMGGDFGSEKSMDPITFLNTVPRVRVEEGTQKYVLICVSPEKNPGKHLMQTVYLVRGNPTVEYHYQCAIDTMKELENYGLEAEIQGGGRIECRKGDKEVEIYGHSYQFGRANHAVTAQLIKKFFGNEFQVSWGDYGY